MHLAAWRLVLVGFVTCLALLAPATASAHPLGNFTTNRYSGIELSGDRVYVVYVLDLAEIPTFQERPRVERLGKDAYARDLAATIARRLLLRVDGRPIALDLLRHELGFPPGVAGLKTTRLEILYGSAPLDSADSSVQLVYRDTNFANRIGWKEITVRASSGAELVAASVPEETVSDALRTYPKDLLQSPLDATDAQVSYRPGAGAVSPPRLSSEDELVARVGVRATGDGGFASLVARDDLTAGVILLSLLVAVFWGAAHAFSPGHGKAIVAAYLIGSRGTARHALYLGLIVTFTHTVGVFALGLVTLALSEFIVPDQLYPWLNLISALLVVGVGVTVLRWRLREWRRGSRGPVHHHDHGHSHVHDHDEHSHVPAPGGGMRGLVSLGVSAGIIPCPTALVVLLAAISLHRVGYGLVLILAFSVGLAAAMTGIGLLAVSAKRAFSRVNFGGGAFRALPAVSALIILAFGLTMTVRALPPIV